MQSLPPAGVCLICFRRLLRARGSHGTRGPALAFALSLALSLSPSLALTFFPIAVALFSCFSLLYLDSVCVPECVCAMVYLCTVLLLTVFVNQGFYPNLFNKG